MVKGSSPRDQGTMLMVVLLLLSASLHLSFADEGEQPTPASGPSPSTDTATGSASQASTTPPDASPPVSAATATTPPPAGSSGPPSPSSAGSTVEQTESGAPGTEPTTSQLSSTPQPTTQEMSEQPGSSPGLQESTPASTSIAADPASSDSGAGQSTSAVPASASASASSSAGKSSPASPPASDPSTSAPSSPVSSTSAPSSPVNSTSAPSSPVSSTSEPTTAAPTTAAPTTPSKSGYPTRKPEKPFILSFAVGDSNDSVVYCTDASNCTYNAVAGDVVEAFRIVPGYLYVREGERTAARRKRDTQFSAEVLFDPTELSGMTKSERQNEAYGAMEKLNSGTRLEVNLGSANQTIVSTFAEHDVCKIPAACPSGYSCRDGACHHLCEGYDCGANGVCNTIVNADSTSSAKCVCSSDDNHQYSGDRCQDEEMSKAKVAAIVGGVLGTLCALFLIVIVVLCCLMRNGDEGSRGKYQLGGYSNDGYTNQEFAMKNVASDIP